MIRAAKLLVAAAILALAATSACAYERVYDSRDFKLNQDSIKYEVPENGAYKIIPRMKNADVWTRFVVPDDASKLADWSATAIVLGVDGASAGIAYFGDTAAAVLTVAPGGAGVLREISGRKTVWKQEFKIENFAYPANLTLRRDGNGSFIAEVDGRYVAARLMPVAVGEMKAWPVRSVSFATRTDGERKNAYVSYERLEVKADGASTSASSLFEQLTK